MVEGLAGICRDFEAASHPQRDEFSLRIIM